MQNYILDKICQDILSTSIFFFYLRNKTSAAVAIGLIMIYIINTIITLYTIYLYYIDRYCSITIILYYTYKLPIIGMYYLGITYDVYIVCFRVYSRDLILRGHK